MKNLKDLLKSVYCRNCDLVQDLYNQNIRLENELFIINQKHSLILNILTLINLDCNIVHIRPINNYFFVVACKNKTNKQGQLKEIKMESYVINRIEKKPYSILNLYSSINYNTNNEITNLHIHDFKAEESEKNKGYGSIVMHQFIKYAKKLSVPKITGSLSKADTKDKENRDLLYHFYPKFGFTITEDEKIRLILDEN